MLRELSDEHPLRFRISDGHEGKRGAGWCEAAGDRLGASPSHRWLLSSLEPPERCLFLYKYTGKSANWQDGTAFHPPSSRLGGGTQRFFLAFGFFTAAGGGLGGRRGGSRRGGAGFAMVWERRREALAQAGPTISYSTAEDRIMVDSRLPKLSGRRRCPRAARPMETPAWGIRARPRYRRTAVGAPVSQAPRLAPRICRGSARRNRSRRSPRRSGGRECSAAGRTARKRAAEWAG